MERRALLKTALISSGAFMLGVQGCSTSTPDFKTDSKADPLDAKKVFMEQGACSSTLFYILNREFGYQKEMEVRAAEPLAGGIQRKGHQCGFLWGASLAVGAESFRRHDDLDQAIGAATTTTQQLMDSFGKTANSINCRGITDCDLTNVFGLMKLILFKRETCFNLAEEWAPKAIQTATDGLAYNQATIPQSCMSCASEVVRKMGASDEEMAMVAGFAGGLGLSGRACGALSAAIWMKNLAWQKKQTESEPDTTDMLKAFDEVTGSRVLCNKITGQTFNTADDHTDYVRNGGCKTLINVLATT
ncbi:C-GCAxxG-C-C family protein [bacterium]|nr:C-GCAxxG-C-C family protein [bacterium]